MASPASLQPPQLLSLTGTVWFSNKEEESSGEGQVPAVSGRIVDPAGTPVAALVALSEFRNATGFRGRQRSTHSTVDGEFAVVVPSWLRFPVRLIAADPHRGLMGERLIHDRTEGKDILLQLAQYVSPRVEGIVLQEDGAPIPHAGILLTRSGPELDGAALCARAAADGRFIFDRLLPDTYYSFTPVVGTRQGPTVGKRVRNGETLALELVMPEASATLTGIVTDRHGNPLPDIRVYFEYKQDFGVTEDVAVTDAEGRFEARAFPGGYFVHVDEKGFGFWSKNVETSGKPVEVVLTRTRTVTFMALGPDELPVDRVSVSGKVETRGSQHLASKSGSYEVEVPETETGLRLHNSKLEAKTVELHWPAWGPLDLGTLHFAKPTRK